MGKSPQQSVSTKLDLRTLSILDLHAKRGDFEFATSKFRDH